jgi:ABC-2 type transport system permease protein
MRLYWELSRLAFRRQMAYRAATLAGLATNVFFGLLRVAVLVALFGARPEVAGYTVEDAITYTGLTQAIIGFLTIFGWYEIMRAVQAGEVAVDLLKPAGYFSFWLARDTGRALNQFLMRSLPIMGLYILIFRGISTPSTIEQWLALALSLVLALLVSFSWRFLVNLAAFWTPNAVGIGRLAFGLSWTLSGFFLPLRFFPDWFVQLCYLTPFPALVNIPVEVYLGLLTGRDLIMALLAQLFWIVALIALGQIVFRAGVRRLVIQGG